MSICYKTFLSCFTAVNATLIMRDLIKLHNQNKILKELRERNKELL